MRALIIAASLILMGSWNATAQSVDLRDLAARSAAEGIVASMICDRPLVEAPLAVFLIPHLARDPGSVTARMARYVVGMHALRMMAFGMSGQRGEVRAAIVRYCDEADTFFGTNGTVIRGLLTP